MEEMSLSATWVENPYREKIERIEGKEISFSINTITSRFLRLNLPKFFDKVIFSGILIDRSTLKYKLIKKIFSKYI